MPSKLPPKDRAWGTRYDTLESSPPASPAAQRLTTDLNPATIQLARDTSRSPADHLNTPTVDRTGWQDGTLHDASIFVGSLPANVDRGELTHRLSEHLSAYPHIKTIKVPYAMRIYRPRNAKYLGLLYDADAINYVSNEQDGFRHNDELDGDGVLFHPLKYDSEVGTMISRFVTKASNLT
ncbi:uncharacterized protein BXZ73DRAFT_96756 [Epithele typhae]|uniref:uncharacterized protein n=1 Tax=Epithele typhae TaxID=378194 RepID=UPI0020085508|nr:uncharacterized protein BXZ73DRAFT_96756 [Epithele typhae]KAH9944263.1 hypothetical protein BXZ73DRAFT_96756 [Epithele typhae]